MPELTPAARRRKLQKTIATNLRKYMKRYHCSFPELSEASSVSARHLKSLCRTNGAPIGSSLETLDKIAGALNVEVEDLVFSGEQRPVVRANEPGRIPYPDIRCDR